MRYLSISQNEIFYNMSHTISVGAAAETDKKEGDNMRLKDIREDLDITQKELAARLHIGQNTYSQYENGQRGLPIEVLMQLTVIFDTSADYILGLTDERRAYPRSERMKL